MLRDLFLPTEDDATLRTESEKEMEQLQGYEVYASVLRPYLGCDENLTLLGQHQKRHRQSRPQQRKEKHCRRCCRRRGKARRPPVKRCRQHDASKGDHKEKEKVAIADEGFDFSQASKDAPTYGVIDFSAFSPAFTPEFKFSIAGNRSVRP